MGAGIFNNGNFTCVACRRFCLHQDIYCLGPLYSITLGGYIHHIMIGIWFLSLIILGLAIYRLVVYHQKVKKYYKVPAVVVGTDIKTVEDALMGDKYFYAAIVEYTDKNGNVHKMVSGEDNPGRPLYQPGAKLPLLIHPDDPTKFLVNDYVGGYIIPFIWIIIGIAIIAIPLLYPDTFKE